MDVNMLELQSTKDLNSVEDVVTNASLDNTAANGEDGEKSEEIEITIGMEFRSIEDAYTVYNKYAFEHGFGIRYHSSKKDPCTGEICRKKIVCNKEGFKKENTEARRRQRDCRTGCKAYMEIYLNMDKVWVVNYFSNNHNHDLTSTAMVKMRSHKKVHKSSICKGAVPQLDESGLKPCHKGKAIKALSGSADAVSSLHVGRIINEERRKNLGKECYGIIQHFMMKSKEDPSWFFAVDLSPDGTLRNVFWADGKSRMAYEKFGDVVIFDVTYKTKKFQMPFAPFVGVNHHFQSTLFGAALLEDETEETFIWLFEQFKICMFDNAPVAIITDQDDTMCKAIKKVFPLSKHRFCAWHVQKQVVERLQSYRSTFPNFQEDFYSWVKCTTKEEFEPSGRTINLNGMCSAIVGWIICTTCGIIG